MKTTTRKLATPARLAALDADAERIASRAAEIVLARLASVVAAPAAVYLTRKGHAPPGWSDEGWRVAAETVPGTYRPTGADGKPGRWLVTPRAAFDAWTTARALAVPAKADAANDAAPWDPGSVVAALGLRSTR